MGYPLGRFVVSRLCRCCAAAILAVCPHVVANAGEALRPPIVGQVWFSDSRTVDLADRAFREGLRDLGYVDGRDVVIVPRYANGDAAKLPALIKDLIELPVQVLLVSSAAVRPAMDATKTVPIVCATMGNALESGLVTNLSRPRGNLTGLSGQIGESHLKLLSMAKELLPGLSRIAMLYDANFPESTTYVSDFRGRAQGAGVTVNAFGVRNLQEIQIALNDIDRSHSQALLLVMSPLIGVHENAILDFASHRFPVIADETELAKAGAVIAYSEDSLVMFRRSAMYVARILRGAKPSDLPIEQPNKFQLMINIRAAKSLGLTIPQSLLVAADEVIQ